MSRRGLSFGRRWLLEAEAVLASDSGRVGLWLVEGERYLFASGGTGLAAWSEERSDLPPRIDLRGDPSAQTLTVQIVDTDGVAASDVLITGDGMPVGVTDIEGSVRVPLAFSTELRALHADGRQVRIRKGASQPFVLAPAHEISGVVADTEGTPLPAVWVHAKGWRRRGGANRGVDSMPVQTDPRGRYLIRKPPGSRPQLGALASGLVPQTTYMDLGDEPQPDGTFPGPDFRLRRAALIEGRIFDEAGRAVPEATVTAFGPVANRMQGSRSPQNVLVKAGREGVFRLETLQPELQYWIGVRAPGFAPRTLEVTPRPATERTVLDIQLQAGRTLFGRVTAAKKRLKGAIVRLSSHRGSPLPAAPPPTGLSGPNDAFTTTDAAGEFFFPHLGTGRYDIKVEADGYGVGVAAGVEPQADALEISLDPAVTLRGKIETGGGDPVAGASIVMITAELLARNTASSDASVFALNQAFVRVDLGLKTGEDGSFSIDGLAPEQGARADGEPCRLRASPARRHRSPKGRRHDRGSVRGSLDIGSRHR